GQLHNLKELIIEGMPLVESIGIEFYGNDGSSFQPFPSLETLHFEDMQEWEEWNLIGVKRMPSTVAINAIIRSCIQATDVSSEFPSTVNHRRVSISDVFPNRRSTKNSEISHNQKL
ncbi:putative CC-NBS-LRR resistance protein, partial [Trifolium pratense]